ncbi:hypothetical protein D3C77_685380 [compost metagenome]
MTASQPFFRLNLNRLTFIFIDFNAQIIAGAFTFRPDSAWLIDTDAIKPPQRRTP